MDILETITVGEVQYDIAPKATKSQFGAVKIGAGLKLDDNEDQGLAVACGEGLGVDTNSKLKINLGTGLTIDNSNRVGVDFNKDFVYGPGLIGTRINGADPDPLTGEKTSPFSAYLGTSMAISNFSYNDFPYLFLCFINTAVQNFYYASLLPDMWIRFTDFDDGLDTLEAMKLAGYPVGSTTESLSSIVNFTMKIHWLKIGTQLGDAYGCRADVAVKDSNGLYIMWSANGIIFPQIGSIYAKWGDCFGTVSYEL